MEAAAKSRLLRLAGRAKARAVRVARARHIAALEAMRAGSQIGAR